jgi:hypothetical protein
VFFVTALVLAAVAAACAHQPVDTGGPPPTDITSAHIERTYSLLNASPFETTADAATAQELYGELTRLSPDSGETACPDAGVHYSIRIQRGSKEVLEAMAIYGGCRVVLMNGKAFSGAGPAGHSFWKTLFAAVGPDGQPDAGSGSGSTS